MPAWRARLVAETTIHSTPSLTREAAAHVDGQVAAVAGRIGAAQLDRLVAETIKRFDLATPDAAADPVDGYLHVDPRHVTLHDGDVHFAGTMRWEAELGIADSLDLDHVLKHRAAEQKALGSTDSLDVRRAKALGDLARTQTALDLDLDLDLAMGMGGGFEARSARTSTTEGTDLSAARELVLHVHFNASTVGERTVFGPTGRMEERHKLLLLDQARSWCGDSRTRIIVKPVIDLNAQLSAPGYDIPDRIREHVILRDQTCVFPWCTRSARRCDLDHVVAYDHDAEAGGRPQPGPTATWNLAPLCRHHHRLKTHTAWRYEMTGNGVFEWTSPHGHRYRRDRTGTIPIDGPDDVPPRVPRPRRR
ncbi:HNH endonuclease [Nocardioides KLBMP 9356]|uniref:HNH endonuclease n=1 Tax=Nocardioides potassii TaxID=2911371 RepID=A0ABS9H9B4_9ACTN|nr:HNH endonuclease signature motif containing protein [Nocardioides potassii]MCF6376805.1 HNH endonuclease [Nocardioides potassii]